MVKSRVLRWEDVLHHREGPQLLRKVAFLVVICWVFGGCHSEKSPLEWQLLTKLPCLQVLLIFNAVSVCVCSSW